MRNYYGGSSVHGGRIRRLGATSFKDLVTDYIDVPVKFPMTRKAFNELSVSERNEKKDGPYIVASSYDFAEGHRKDETAVSVNLVILDLDEGDFVKDFFEAPDTIGEHLFPFSFVAWTTAKHTAKNPRLKIMIDIEPSHPGLHRRFVDLFAAKLGLPDTFKGYKESTVVSQPQYRPVQFQDEHFPSVIASRTDGIAASEADLPEVEEEEDTVAAGRSFACDDPADLTGLGLAFLPVLGLDVDDIREPLFAIDPDVGYREWVEIVCALKHQFPEEQQAADAYDLFNEWSSNGTKYRGDDATYAKGRNPITISSLFHHAKTLGGWENSKVASKLKLNALEWIESCEDGDELMTEGAKRIAAMPFQNSVLEETLILAWRKRLKELTGNMIEKNVLKKEVSKTKRRDQAEKMALKEEKYPGWIRPYCYIATQNVFHNTTTDVDLSPVSFDNKYSVAMMPADPSAMPANGRPVMPPSAYALNVLNINRVDETIFYPLWDGDDRFFPHKGRKFLNLYDKHHAPTGNPDTAVRALAMLKEHLSKMIPEDWLIDLFIDWHAYIAQNPGKKPRWSFLIQSAEGAGKGFFGKIARGFMGERNVRIVSPEVLKSQWNDWGANTLYIILEEVHIPGEMRERVTNSVKQIITDDVFTINKRNTHAQCDVPNFASVIAFTNYKDALHLKESSRRWCVINSQLQTEKQIAELNATGHFEKMEWLLTEDGAAGLRYALERHAISSDFPVNGPAPSTKYRDSLIRESKNRIQVAIEDIIESRRDAYISQDFISNDQLLARLPGVTKDPTRLAHYLHVLGYDRHHCKIEVDNELTEVWIHHDAPSDDPHVLLARIEATKDFEI